jgi:serine/threonine protein kinase
MASILFSLFTLFGTLPSKCLGRSRSLGETYPDAVAPETKRFLAAGKSGVVYEIDSHRVLKEYHDADACGTEHIVYKRLGSHPNIALRSICRAPSANAIPIETKVRWLRHAAEGCRYLHTHGIVHSDVGTHNWILTGQNCIKLIDFEGCSIDGGPAGSCYEWFSYQPSMPRVSEGTDIFAFGCVIYELSTGRPPYHELEASDDRYKQVEELYATRQFPDVTNLPLGWLIQKCWDGNASSMSEIIIELATFPT